MLHKWPLVAEEQEGATRTLTNGYVSLSKLVMETFKCRFEQFELNFKYLHFLVISFNVYHLCLYRKEQAFYSFIILTLRNQWPELHRRTTYKTVYYTKVCTDLELLCLWVKSEESTCHGKLCFIIICRVEPEISSKM